MGKSMKDADAGRKSRRSILWLVMAALLAVLISVFAFLGFYSAYIDKTLYAERLSQMREFTTIPLNLFSPTRMQPCVSSG